MSDPSKPVTLCVVKRERRLDAQSTVSVLASRAPAVGAAIPAQQCIPDNVELNEVRRIQAAAQNDAIPPLREPARGRPVLRLRKKDGTDVLFKKP